MNIQVSMVIDQAQAVLSILQACVAGTASAEDGWQALFASQGYQRLKQRELQMGNAFDDADFRSFLLAPETVGQAAALAAALEAWQQVDLARAAGRALAYLPEDSPIRAAIYPVIKPRSNSFIFEAEGELAIFLYVNPAVGVEKLTNTLAHELHHVGYAGLERQMQQTAWWGLLPETHRAVLEWASALGEGVAMLAAAGGPYVHPHAAGSPEERARWDGDMANAAQDLVRLDKFFQAVLDGCLQGQAMMEAGFAFFGHQGPWYTVGWKTAATIETVLGRPQLIECLRDPRRLFRTYNQAVAQMGEAPLPTWSVGLAALAGDAQG